MERGRPAHVDPEWSKGNEGESPFLLGGFFWGGIYGIGKIREDIIIVLKDAKKGLIVLPDLC
jgi:hypothetical protein